MDKNFNLRRLKRIYKLTGEYDWISKYAEEAPKGSSDYKIPTIKRFLSNYISANSVNIAEAEKQANIAQAIIGDISTWYLDKVDLDEPAFTTIKYNEDISVSLNPALVNLTDEDRLELINNARKAISKLGDEDLSVYAKNLSNEQIDNLIKFTLTRGYIQSYLLFIYNYPIVSILTGATDAPKKKKAFPLSLKSLLKVAIEPSAEYAKEIQKIIEDNSILSEEVKSIRDAVDLYRRKEYDEEELVDELENYILTPGRKRIDVAFRLDDLYKQMETAVEAERWEREEEEAAERIRGEMGDMTRRFLETEKTPIRLSQAISGMKIVRMQKLTTLEKDPLSTMARKEYLFADAIITYLSNIQIAVRDYIKKDPRNKVKAFMGQPLAGFDGEGDIIIGMVDDLNNLQHMGLKDLLGRAWAVGQDVVPPLQWEDIDGNPLYFSTGRESEMRSVPVVSGEEKRTLGKPIPTHDNQTLFIQDKYRDGKDAEGNIIPGIEISKREMLEAAFADIPLLVEFKKNSPVSDLLSEKLRNHLLDPSLSDEDADRNIKIAYAVLLESLNQAKNNLSVDNFSKNFVDEMSNFVTQVMDKQVPTASGYSMHLPSVIDMFLSEVGIPKDIARAAETFNEDYSLYFVTKSQTPEGLEKQKKARTGELKAALKAAGMDEVQQKEYQSKMYEDIERAIDEKVKELDKKYNHTPGTSRNSSLYFEQIAKKGNKQAISTKLHSEYSKVPEDVFRKIVQWLADRKYPDAARSKAGQSQFGVFWNGTDNADFTDKLDLTNSVNKSLHKNIEEKLKEHPDLKEKLYSFINSNIRPMKLNEELARELKPILGKQYDTLVRKMAITNYGRRLALDLQNIFGNDMYQMQNAQWKEDFEESVKKMGKTGRDAELEEYSKEVQRYYRELITKLPEVPEFPSDVSNYRVEKSQAAAEGQKTFMENEKSNALLNSLIGFMREYRGGPGNPHGDKVIGLMNTVFPNEPFKPVMAHALYTYLGEICFDAIKGRAIRSEKAAEVGIYDSLTWGLYKRFRKARTRGVSGEGAQDVSDPSVAADEASAHLLKMQKSPWAATYTRKKGYEYKLLMEEGIEHIKPTVALSTHSVGGIIQQIMGYSLSPNIANKLEAVELPPVLIKTGPRAGQLMERNVSAVNNFIGYFAKGCASSMGQEINNNTSKAMSALWRQTYDEHGNEIKRAIDQPTSLWHFMEMVRCYADPIYALKPFSEVFEATGGGYLKTQEKSKKEQGYYRIVDPDTAYRHYDRVRNYVQNMNWPDVKDQFEERLNERVNDLHNKYFNKISKDLFEEHLIIRYNRLDHVHTNSPFTMNLEDMEKRLFKLNISVGDIIDIVDLAKRESDRLEEIGEVGPDTLDDVPYEEEQESYIADMEQSAAFSFNEVKSFFNRIIKENPFNFDDWGLTELKEGIEALLAKFSNDIQDPEVERSVFSTPDSWIEKCEAILVELPETFAFAKMRLPYLLKDAKSNLVPYQNAVDNFVKTEIEKSKIIEQTEEQIDDIEEEQKYEMEQGDEEQVDKLQKDKEQIEVQAPDLTEQVPIPDPQQEPVSSPIQQQPQQPQDWEKMLQDEFGEVEQPEPEQEEDLSGAWRPEDEENDKFSSLVFHSKLSNKTKEKDIWEDEDHIFFG